MNIFYTSHSTVQCAKEHCRRHRVKMILESCQLLSTCHHIHGTHTEHMYKPFNPKHPSCIWTAESAKHYNWLYSLAYNLCILYKKLHFKQHASWPVLTKHLNNPPECLRNKQSWTPPYAAMPEEFKSIQDRTEAYQTYLNSKFSEWQSREKPLAVVFDALDGAPHWYKEEV